MHRNSGVQNRWYFLLCDGSYARNSSFVEGRQPYSITRISMEHALQIAYHTLMQNATSQAQNADIRHCHLQSAKDHYGDNSPPGDRLANAWDIVGVTDGNATGINSIGQSGSLTPNPLPRAKGVGTRTMAACLKASPQRKVCIFITGKKS